MDRKLRDSRGETLVEVMASVLISALSVALLFGGVMASVHMDAGARERDEAYYAALSAAELQAGPAAAEGVVRLEAGDGPAGGPGLELPVSLYGGGETYAYALDDAGEAAP